MNKFSDINIFVKNNLEKQLAELEIRRKKWLLFAVLFSLISLFICILLALNIELDKKTIGPVVFVAILPYVMITEKYKLDIQNRVMESFLSYFAGFEYSEQECIPDYKIIKSKLFHCNKNDSRACFSGLVNNNKTTTSITKLFLQDEQSLQKECEFDGIISMSLSDNFFEHEIIIANNADVEFFSGLPRVNISGIYAFCQDNDYAKLCLSEEFKNWFNSIEATLMVDKYAVSLFENTILISLFIPDIKPFKVKSIFTSIRYTDEMNALYVVLIKLLEVNFLRFSTPKYD